jgi:hypothetical protein
MTTH